MEKIKDYVKPNMYAAFSANNNDIKNEIANINQVVVQYEYPIDLGMVKDVEAEWRIYEQKIEEAGVDKVLDELSRQTEVYLKSKK